MTNQIPLAAVGLNVDQSGRGILTVQVGDATDFQAVIDRLAAGAVLYDNLGRTHNLTLDGQPPPRPTELPCEVDLNVVETDPPTPSAGTDGGGVAVPAG